MGSRTWTASRSGIRLPSALSTFIGRERELAEASRLLQAARLLTLVGTGGIGKTRLALEVARMTPAQTVDEAVFVDLSRYTEPSLAVVAVANELGVQELPNQQLIDQITEAIGARRLLLVLDNCEQLVQACAELAERLLGACPGLRILATSREPLRLVGETVWRVPVMSLPERRTHTSSRVIARAEAVRLFEERARAVRPDFSLTDKNATEIAELCRRLDGLPLALELAAAQMSVLGIRELVQRLDAPLRLLARGGRTTPPRHQTLRGALDWSHELLSPPERRLFARCSVFAAGWTLEATEAVCADPAAAADTEPASIGTDDVMPLLARLVETSLVLAEPAEDGILRYRFLDTVREYASQRLLELGEVGLLHARHVAYFLGMVEQAAIELRGGPNQIAWLSRLEREHDQLRAALAWTTSHDLAPEGLRLAGGLWRFWWLHSHISEGLMWLETALAAGSGSATERAHALNGTGILAHTRGDLDFAERLFREALRLRREAGDLPGIAAALHNLGNVARERGDFDDATVLCTESLELERQLGNTWGVSVSLGSLAKLAHVSGKLEEAAALQQQGLDLARENSDQRSIATGLINLAEIMRDLGEYQRSAELAAESLALWNALGDRWSRATVLNDLARLALLEGNAARAVAPCIESLQAFQELESKQGIAVGLETLATILGAMGRPESAARIFGTSDALRDAVGSPLTPAEEPLHARAVSVARRVIGATRFERASAEGRGMDPAAAIRSVLPELEQGAQPRRTEVAAAAAKGDPFFVLTTREREVLGHLADGLSNRQIADELIIGIRTVETHVERILHKLNFDNRAQAMVWARERDHRGPQTGTSTRRTHV